MALIYHLTYRSHWNFAKLRDEYKTDSLENEGFIHCCDKKQILSVANSQFKGEKDLLLLIIDSSLLNSELRYETLGASDLYPHIFGPLNLDAVVQVLDFKTDASARFILPNKLL